MSRQQLMQTINSEIGLLMAVSRNQVNENRYVAGRIRIR